MSMLSTVFVLAAFCVVGSLQTTVYRKCNNAPAPINLQLSGCDVAPCPLVKGSFLQGTWDFVVTRNTKKLTPKVRVTVLGVTTSYDYPQQDACKSLVNARCPLDKGEVVTYNSKMPIDKSYPNIGLTIEFSLVNEFGEPQSCFLLDGKVTN